MFSRLLVALDGSPFAEYALDPALELAAKFGSDLLLVRVIAAAASSVQSAGAGLPGSDDAIADARFYRAEAEAYLQRIQARGRSSGLNVYTRVVAGEPAVAITALAAAQEVDLIVMSTHGRTGVMRLLYGSVAEAVLRGSGRAVMLVPIGGGRVGAKQ
jgi:nucleotide-binding universal stress UspA family protein